MKEENIKTINIEREMRECFEEIGLPNLASPEHSGLLKSAVDDFDHILPSKLIMFYDDYYYNRATVRMEIYKQVLTEQEVPVKELLNSINTDLAFDHLCLDPNHMVCFQTGLWVPDDHLPRDKFKKLLQKFFEDYCRYTPIITKLLVEGGEPEKLWLDFLLNRATFESQRVKNYEKILQGLREALTELGLTMQNESEADNCISISNNLRIDNHRVRLIAAIIKDRKHLCIEMIYRGELAEDGMSDAIEMANKFNATSCIGHIYVLRGFNYVALASGLPLDHNLDKDEFKNLFHIVIALGMAHLPVIMKLHTSNISSMELIRKMTRDGGES